MSQPRVAVLTINTGNYAHFFQSLYPYNFTNFLPDCYVEYFCFTDSSELKTRFQYNSRVNIIPHTHEEWPNPTLKRWHTFLAYNQVVAKLKTFDYIFFVNANYYCKRPLLATELLFPITGDWHKDLIFLEHYGQNLLPESHRSFERNPESTAYVPLDATTTYVSGGFIGGSAAAFLTLCQHLKEQTDQDLISNYIALWHDESHLNRFAWQNQYQTHILPVHYAVPQEYDFTAKYIGERQDWYAVFLNKNALVSDLLALRNIQNNFDPRLIECLIINEREIENYWQAHREEFYPQAIASNSFNTFAWKLSLPTSEKIE